MPDTFLNRHVGPDQEEENEMLKVVGAETLDQLIQSIVPESIQIETPLDGLGASTEQEALNRLREYAAKNEVKRSLIGMGYTDTVLPPVIQRNILENPGWYTAYTPYQAEISQGRMEALLNFQTMVTDLTGMEIANASLLDEATAVAEAVSMAWAIAKKPEKSAVLIDSLCHPQTIEVVRTRAQAAGVELVVGDLSAAIDDRSWVAVISQYPNTRGEIEIKPAAVEEVKAQGGVWIVAADLLALTILPSPSGEGADVVVGSTQRFGMPMGYGGPHAAFFATRDKFKRQMPGRLIGVSKDAEGDVALRLSLQTREQHIRRDKATSNICTAQVLPAVVASMFAVYHGPDGLREIAERIATLTHRLRDSLIASGFVVSPKPAFDTLVVTYASAKECQSVHTAASAAGFNLRSLGEAELGITLDEKSDLKEIESLLRLLTRNPEATLPSSPEKLDPVFSRENDYLSHPTFHQYRSETNLLRYMKSLENKDISLTRSMIALGSCTMKLNATAEMMPITWNEFAQLHPFAPPEQASGYHEMMDELSGWLAELTGFDAVSLQPNAGSQGEYAGLLAIKYYQESIGQSQRKVCLIPESAHGTNFASAIMVGFKVVLVHCDEQGNIDIAHLKRLAEEYKETLAASMVTYPSTHGVFEEGIKDVCRLIHEFGGQVYMDGANLNAQVGWTSPGAAGADVCHLNLHKTFCIPHGGGGPGMGPIGVAAHLKNFLPGHSVGNESVVGPVSAATWGSAVILAISWAYIAMMGGKGLRKATAMAILNANYIARRLDPYFPVLYKGRTGHVAHECILDLRSFREFGVEVEDVAKRLIDFGYHAPTMSWPVAGTLMVEPTESESLEELDLFCEAMLKIHEEIMAVKQNQIDPDQSPLKHAPHTAACLIQNDWDAATHVRKRLTHWPGLKKTNIGHPCVGSITSTAIGISSVPAILAKRMNN
ncbi:MAG: aminomethyl-transferring glycine dehydrogenase [Verrucomicrobiota bacterium]